MQDSAIKQSDNQLTTPLVAAVQVDLGPDVQSTETSPIWKIIIYPDPVFPPPILNQYFISDFVETAKGYPLITRTGSIA